ncbi:E3 ubiquitin-protein ligase HECTD1 [Mytilus galloprovincialis]|uniref:E3 ubiquitin-protein ligase HECTD1 n=1 Tax=Mytilus galloprovincialis TaxID=29158 RepID=A0A8B6G2T5_MYTGA|nr:E3 ubiquitin-protein ligase HECTD1 [Mytilus galloprovincialis]
MKLVLSHGKISSRGHKYMLLLDTSESMKGEKFDIMIKAATSFVDVPLDILTLFIDDITICTGLHTVSLRYGIRDNVGLAHFGKDTKLIMHPLADYDANLRPGGPSPLAAGLLMALSGITHLGPTTIEHRDFLPYIIVITDGMPTRVDAPGEEDRDSIGALSVSSLLTMLNLVRDSEIDKTVTNIALRGIKICCVPVGGANTDIMSKVVKKTFGKLIPPDQIHRLAQNTQILIHAAEIANKLEKNTEFTRTSVKAAVHSASLQELDAYDDITDNVMLLLDPVTQYHGRFKQPRCKAVQLGTRVRRGPNWQWKNQDSNMAGTVIGEDKDGMIWVEWDSGVKNCYHYDDSQRLYDIKPVNEPRRLVDEMIAVGCKVKRGKDWKYEEQDGGRGSRGTILRVESNGKVVVHWDRGRLGTYKFACDDLFEVAVCEDGRTISSPDLIEDEQNSRQEMMPDLPLILPSHTNKMKPVQSTWQYQDASGSWQSYDEETNVKLDRAYSRRPNGIEEHLANFENITCRDSTQLQAILETTEKLSEKLDILSTALKNRTTNVESTESNKQRLQTDTYSTRKEPNQTEQKTVPSSCKQNVKEIHEKEQESCSKLQKDVVPETVTDKYCRSQIKVKVSNVDKLKEEKQQKPKIRQLVNGFKHYRTNQDLDNRMCYKRKKPCFQGEMLNPPIATTALQSEKEPSPNITINYVNERSPKKTYERQRGRMALAQNAERDVDSGQQVHSYDEWVAIAGQARSKVRMELAFSNSNRSASGHNYILLLDTSESMQGEKFKTMIKTATRFIDGLHQVSLRYGIRDNVGLAHFGKDTELIMHPIPEYDYIKREIAKLRPCGPSPLAAGLLMALSGIHSCMFILHCIAI